MKGIGIAAILLAVALGLFGQSSEKALHFDAASIKPYGGAQGDRTGGSPPLRFTPGMVASRSGGVTVRTIVLNAYGLTGRSYLLSAGPAWLDSDLFELEAKAADSSADQTQLRLMLQSLLAQRFRFGMHREKREMPVYTLTVGKSGIKFRELKDGEDPPSPPSAEMVNRITMQGFVDVLNTGAGHLFAGLDRPVMDNTRLHGTYFFVLRPWDRDDDFKAVVEAQLGLKFEAQKAVMDVLVIDHIEKPDAN